MRTATWTNIGRDVTECKDMAQVLRASGLDYEVVKRPVYMDTIMGRKVIPNRFVTVRSGDDHPYDVVSDKFEIVQNAEAFDFVNYMGDELEFEKAGETENGMVYIIGKLPEVDILGDKFIPHVIFRNGFTGKVKITAAICPLRFVCQNQFNFAFRNTQNSITVRHVRNAEAKLQEAKETLKLSADYMAELNRTAEHFAGLKISGERAKKVLDYLFPIPEGQELNPFKKKTLEDARGAFLKAHEAEDNRNFRGTAWGLINAYTDYITHKDPQGKTDTKYEGKFMNTTFKLSMNPIINAIEAVC